MKKEIVTGLLMAVDIFAAVGSIGRMTVSPTVPDNIYSTTVMVTEVNHRQSIVTVSTVTGVQYTIKECEDWNIGDICSVIMSDNSTREITDDEVLRMKYTGTIEDWEWIELDAIEHQGEEGYLCEQ